MYNLSYTFFRQKEAALAVKIATRKSHQNRFCNLATSVRDCALCSRMQYRMQYSIYDSGATRLHVVNWCTIGWIWRDKRYGSSCRIDRYVTLPTNRKEQLLPNCFISIGLAFSFVTPEQCRHDMKRCAVRIIGIFMACTGAAIWRIEVELHGTRLIFIHIITLLFRRSLLHPLRPNDMYQLYGVTSMVVTMTMMTSWRGGGYYGVILSD